MKNAWTEIALSDYEGHMSSSNVMQMQTINSMMKERDEYYDVNSLMILGVAGGNGLEHFNSGKYEAVYGVDINPDYLDECRKRYSFIGDKLKLCCVDLVSQCGLLPHSELLIADLLIEYIGLECFCSAVKKVSPKYISCGIQLDTDDSFVSETPYIHSFDSLDSIHRTIDRGELIKCMQDTGYELISATEYPLPNGKKIIRADFAEKQV